MSEKKIAPIHISGTATDVSAEVLPANPRLRYLLIQNRSTTQPLYIMYGAPATVTEGILIEAGGSYESDAEIISSVNVICDSTFSAAYVVMYG
jgi:hypothetical protein